MRRVSSAEMMDLSRTDCLMLVLLIITTTAIVLAIIGMFVKEFL